MNASTSLRPPPTATSVWRRDGFAGYCTAQTVSTAGDAVTSVALPVIAAIDLHASTFHVALLGVAGRLPALMFSLPAGALVDRHLKRPVLIVCQAGSGLALATVPAAALIGATPTLTQLYLVAFTVAALGVVGSTASISYLPHLVDRDQLVAANSTLGSANSAATLIGSNSGGALVSALGSARAVLLDCASYLISVALLLRIRHPEPAVERTTRPPLRTDIRAGLAYVWHQPILRAAVTSNAVNSSAMSASSALWSLYLIRDLGYSPTVLGLILGAGSVGGILGGLAGAKLATRSSPAHLILSCLAIVPLAQLPLVLVHPGIAGRLALGGGMLVQTAAVVAGGGIIRSIRQSVTRDDMQGRAQAAAAWIAFGLRPLAALAAGGLGTLLGLRPTLALTAAVLFIPFFMLWHSPVRALRTMPAPATPVPAQRTTAHADDEPAAP